MLPTSHRLKSKKNFSDLFKKGRTFSNDVLLMKIIEGRKGSPSCFGFGVSPKFSKKATERNKVKRWMREAVRAKIGKIQSGQKVVFLINPKFPKAELNFGLIQEKVENLLKQANIL